MPVMWPHTVTLYPSVPVLDERGNLVRRPARNGHSSRAYVQPRASTDDRVAGVAEQAVAYLPPEAPRLDAFSRLVWAGITYETTGAAVALSTPAGPHHWRVELRKVGA